MKNYCLNHVNGGGYQFGSFTVLRHSMHAWMRLVSNVIMIINEQCLFAAVHKKTTTTDDHNSISRLVSLVVLATVTWYVSVTFNTHLCNMSGYKVL